MKTILLTLLSLIFCSSFSYAKNNRDNLTDRKSSVLHTINTLDTIVFDLSKAVFVGSNIEIPVSILSNDTVLAVDFSFRFNEAILKYDSIINYKAPDLSTLAHFNLTDRKLRFTSSSLKQIDNNTRLISIRFVVTSGCGKITPADFNNFKTYLNGDPCSYKIIGAVKLANFTATNTCLGGIINFADNSSTPIGTISSWDWAFGDGTTGIQQNPSHTYTASGTYSVSLIIITNQGCSDTIIKAVTTGTKPIVKFGGTNLSGCVPLTVNFSDSSTTSLGSTFFWDFGDSGTSSSMNAAYTYTTSGVYAVKHYVTAVGGCTDSIIKTSYINVFPKPVASFTVATICVGSIAKFIDASTINLGTINSWNWNFGDGNTANQKNPSHSYTTSGTYTVTLQVTSNKNCSDVIVKTITVVSKPIVKFGGNNLFGCMPLVVNFTDSSITSSGSTFSWDFGDNVTAASKNAIHTYTASGTYTIKHYITNSASCMDSLVKVSYITVYSKPAANFTAPGVCFGSPINFTDNSTISSGTINSWNWNFGDGNTSTQQNSSHTYTTSISYSVSLIITSTHGCSDTVVKTVTIAKKPTVKFGGTNLSGCIPHTVNFSDSSIASPGSIYFWVFGDNGTSTATNASHTYATSGIYTVKHYVTAIGGCMDSLVRSSYITVFSKPIANFTVANTCLGTVTSFTDNSSIAGGVINSWNWKFGDGSNSTQQKPLHTYTIAGTYSVSLLVTSNQNCSDSMIKIITIENKPIIKFSAAVLSGCAPLAVNFTDSSTTSIGSTFSWNFGDNGTSNSMNTSHTYTAGGAYTVKHYVTTSVGCSDSLIKPSYIKVDSVPLVSFTAAPDTAILPNAVVTFTNSSSGGSTWLWKFGDGDSSLSKNALHNYILKGTYKVCLTAYNSSGCFKTYCDTIIVRESDINPPVGVPNAFTPNGDFRNDVLIVKGGPMDKMDFRIFNEWGNQLFFSDTQSEGWDGNFKGLPQLEGAYIYTLKGKTVYKKNIDMHGVVNLVR